MKEDSSRRSRAEEVFDDYLSRREAGEAVDFEGICRAHADLASDLCLFQAALEVVLRFRPELVFKEPLSKRLKERFGAEVDATLSLEPEPRPDQDAASRVFGKLRSQTQRWTRYRLLDEVARGGMGAVMRIWDEELRRTLAMKMVLGRGQSSDLPAVDPRLISRFLEEAQVTGQLDHPGIVPVHELGLASDGRVYFTMRLVKGEDLSKIFQHVRTGHEGWSQVRAIGVVLKVCEAMSYAHSKHVLHRDLKPSNVMVGKFGEVYVMDWGLARVLGRADKHDLRLDERVPSSFSAVKTERHEERADSPDSPLFTMDGDVVGTPSFMPPEQAKGQLQQLGAHSDVYAVGALLYGLVAGEMPYVPRDARVSARTILTAVLQGPPRPLNELAPQTPAELIAIVEKAMEREIANRYPTMQALAEDLRAYVEGRVVHAYETGAWAEARKWVKRNKSLAMALLAAVVILCGGVVTSTVFAVRSNAKAEEARHNLEAEMHARQRAEREALLGIVVNMIYQRLTPAMGNPELRASLVTRADSIVTAVKAARVAELGDCMWIQSARHRVDFASRDGHDSDRHVIVPVETEDDAGPLVPILALAIGCKFEGKWTEALDYYDSSIALMRAKLPEGHWLLSPFLIGSTPILVKQGKFEEAERRALEGYLIARGFFGPGNQLTTNGSWALVNLYESWNKTALAVEWRRKSADDEAEAEAEQSTTRAR